MKKQAKMFMLLTGAAFIVQAGLLAARFTPGEHPVMHEITRVLVAPTSFCFRFLGQHLLWPFSEKAGLAFAILAGVITILTSMLYAGILLTGMLLIKKLKRHEGAEQPDRAITQETARSAAP